MSYEAYAQIKIMCVSMCLFVLMSTHCTVTYFGFHATWIDGATVVYFRFTHLLSRQSYMGDGYLYCLLKEGNVYVIAFVLCVVCSRLL